MCSWALTVPRHVAVWHAKVRAGGNPSATSVRSFLPASCGTATHVAAFGVPHRSSNYEAVELPSARVANEPGTNWELVAVGG